MRVRFSPKQGSYWDWYQKEQKPIAHLGTSGITSCGFDELASRLEQHQQGRIRVLEIGFGRSMSFVQQVEEHQDTACFLGIDVFKPAIGLALAEMDLRGLGNLFILHANAINSLENSLSAFRWDKIQIFFSDPWPKARHHKRRLIQPAHLALYLSCIKPGGVLHFCTDDVAYAEFMDESLAGMLQFTKIQACPFGLSLPKTAFFNKAQNSQNKEPPIYEYLFRVKNV